MTELVTLHRSGAVATLTLNRPESRNALSLDLLDALRGALRTLAQPGPEHVLVVTGAGKAFCAGMDLKAVLGAAGLPLRLLSALAEVCLALRALPMVTVAKVNGAAIGGGCGLATVCDLGVTHADAKLGFPEVDLGVCPAVVAPWLARKIGHGRARAVLLSGGVMSGTRALDLGIVNHVAATRDELDPLTDSLVARIAAGGPGALRATKALLNTLDGSLDRDSALRGAALSAGVLDTPEAQASLRASLDKRS